MNPKEKTPFVTSRSRLSLLLGLFLAFGGVQATVATPAAITVTNPTDVAIPFTCNLRQAIVAHDEKRQPFPSNCAAGDGNDTIIIGRFPRDRIIRPWVPAPRDRKRHSHYKAK